MIILLFDTETTGLPFSKQIHEKDVDKWPHIVQLSYILFEVETQTVLKNVNHYVSLPQGELIPSQAIAIHGITDHYLQLYGIPIENALHEFMQDLDVSDEIVAHNIEFDVAMIHVALLRLILKFNQQPYMLRSYEKQISKYKQFLQNLLQKKYFCTMKNSIELCQLKRINKWGKPYMKYPKLSELYHHLFHVIPQNLHDASVDCLACLKCYCKMKHKIDLQKI